MLPKRLWYLQIGATAFGAAISLPDGFGNSAEACWDFAALGQIFCSCYFAAKWIWHMLPKCLWYLQIGATAFVAAIPCPMDLADVVEACWYFADLGSIIWIGYFHA